MNKKALVALAIFTIVVASVFVYGNIILKQVPQYPFSQSQATPNPTLSPIPTPTTTEITPKPIVTAVTSVTITYWEINRAFTSNATAIFIDWTLGGSSVSYNPNEFYLVDNGVRISVGPSYTSFPYTTKHYPILDLVVDGIYGGNTYQLANDHISLVGSNLPVTINWVKQ